MRRRRDEISTLGEASGEVTYINGQETHPALGTSSGLINVLAMMKTCEGGVWAEE